MGKKDRKKAGDTSDLNAGSKSKKGSKSKTTETSGTEKSSKRLGGPPNGNNKGSGTSKKGTVEKQSGSKNKDSQKRLGGPPGGSTKKKKGQNAATTKLSKAEKKKQRAAIEKARKAEQQRMLAGGFSSEDEDPGLPNPSKPKKGQKANAASKKSPKARAEEERLQEERELARKRREMKAKRAAKEAAKSGKTTGTPAFAPALPPAKLMERIMKKLAESDGDESVLTRKEKKSLEQHRRATEAAEAEALAAQDPLRYFSLSDLESSSGDGHANLKDVVIECFTIHAGKKCLFHNSTLKLVSGRRYGLVGPNGHGKTTVLRFLATRKLPIPANMTCLHVEQEVSASHLSALATVLAADEQRAKLAAELERVHCQLDAVTAEAKVTALKSTLESIEQRLSDLPAFEMLDAEPDAELDAAEKRKLSSDRDLYLALKTSKTAAEAELATANGWLDYAKNAEDSSSPDAGDDLIGEMERLYDELDAIGADAAESRACKVLAGLGFSQEMQRRETFKFSGGWRMRISLARALFMNPDLLLLDEPTNHLDIDTVLWLEHYLKTEYEGTLFVVSHDQDFLSEVCTSMVLLDDKQLHFFDTTYDSFFDRQELFNKQKQAAYEKQQKWIRQAKSRLKRGDIEQQIEAGKFATLEPGGKPADVQPRLLSKPKEYTVNFHFPDVTDDTPYIDVDKVSFRYREDLPLLFKNLDFPVNCATKATIVGPNGAGKSTLLQVIYGDLEPTTGSVNRKGALRVGYFNQHFDDSLDLQATGVEFLLKSHPRTITSKQTAHMYLGRFGLGSHAHRIPISEMSGGQKARVVFAHLAAQGPHILLLDEPTNNLDIESINALIDGINAFNGGVIVISHDARLIANTQMNLWLCDGDGQVTPLREGFDKYRARVLIEHADRVEYQVRLAKARSKKRRDQQQEKIDRNKNK